MTKLLRCALTLAFGFSLSCCAQTPGTPTVGPGNTAGLLYASNFGLWQVPQGNTGQYSWSSPSFCTVQASGIPLNPVFAVGSPVYIKDQVVANSEIVTPSAVNVGGAGCSITVSPSNKHNTFVLISGTAGLQEAINYAHGLPYEVILTPDWSRLGGTTGMITAALGNSNVQISDQRGACIIAYIWSGSAYVSQPSSCSGGSSGGVTQILAGTNVNISPPGGNGVVTINATGGDGVPSISATLPIEVNGGAGPVTTDATISCPTCGQFQPQYTPPLPTGQFVVLPGVATCTNPQYCSAGDGSLDISIPESPDSLTIYSTSFTFVPSALPSYVNPANITAVYALSWITVTGSPHAIAPGSCFLFYPVNGQKTSLLGNTSAALSPSYPGACSTGFGGSQASPGFGARMSLSYYVYYTGTPPPPSVANYAKYPLYYNAGTLGLIVPYDGEADTGALNAYTVSLPAFDWIAPWEEIKFTPTTSNTSSAPTLNVNGWGAATIVRAGGSPLVAGDIATTTVANVIYNPPNWELQNPVTIISGAGSGVSHVNAVDGDVNIVAGSNVTVSTDTGTKTITIASTGGGGGSNFVAYPAADTNHLFGGDSRFLVSTTCATSGDVKDSITSGVVTGGVGVFSVTNTMQPGNKVTLTGFTGSYAPLNGQIITLTAATLSSVTATVTGVPDGATGSGTFECTYNVPSQFSRLSWAYGHGTVINLASAGNTISNMISTYNTVFHPYAPATKGHPAIAYIQIGSQDVLSGNDGSAVISGMPTLWALFHADGIQVVETSLIPVMGSALGQPYQAANLDVNSVNDWLGAQGPSSSATSKWDVLADLYGTITDPLDSYYILQAGTSEVDHPTDQGAAALAETINAAMIAPSTITKAKPFTCHGNGYAGNNECGFQMYETTPGVASDGSGSTLGYGLVFRDAPNVKTGWVLSKQFNNDRWGILKQVGSTFYDELYGSNACWAFGNSYDYFGFDTPDPIWCSDQTTAGMVDWGRNATKGAGDAGHMFAYWRPGVLFSAAGTALPACTSALNGELRTVSDATTRGSYIAYASGGNLTAQVMCDGATTTWLIH